MGSSCKNASLTWHSHEVRSVKYRVQGTTTSLPPQAQPFMATASLQKLKKYHIKCTNITDVMGSISSTVGPKTLPRKVNISVPGLPRSQRLVWKCCPWHPTWPPSFGTLPHASRRSWSSPPGRCSPWSRRGSPPCRSEWQRQQRLIHKLIRFTYPNICLRKYIAKV